tara:strand:+ start:6962 stop:7459 length:498 start_codon:yes stop_codon:yes gene_type:complete
MLRVISTVAALFAASTAFAENIPITGNVASKCTVYTDVAGVYGNPAPDQLDTDPIKGGVDPVVRYDVTIADYYTAKISWPNQFASSPSLTDALNWDGEVTVSSTSDAGMAGYEAAKVEYDNITEYDLSVAGSTWFQVESSVTYGYEKSFPGGDYTANITAECIAN